MKAELAIRLNNALQGIETAKTELNVACVTSSNDESIEAAGDRYEAARQEMAETMRAIGETE